MSNLLNGIANWFKQKGGFSHVCAAIFLALMAAYAAVPAFHQMVNQIHDALPAWVQELATTALALYAWYKTTRSPVGTVIAARKILDSPDAPTASQIASATTKTLLLFALILVPFATGCKAPTATVPLAPGYYTAAEQTVGEVIAAANGAVLRYEKDVKAGTYTPNPAMRSAADAIQKALVVADPLAVAWHKALAANATAPEPPALASAVQTINAKIGAIPGSVTK